MYRMTIAALVFFSFIQRTSGTSCFEIDDHDYTLKCVHGEKTIYNQLVAQCGSYQDGVDDCARFFITTLKFCSGVFGGAICTLDFHAQNQANACAVHVIR